MLLPLQAHGGGARPLRQPRLYRGCGRAIDACLRHRRKVVGGDGWRSSSRSIVGFGNVQQQFFPISRAAGAASCRSAAARGVVDHRDDRSAVEEAEALLKGDADVEHSTAYVGQGSVALLAWR